jgi:parvulin-like peptidyl-prolyl isomerase
MYTWSGFNRPRRQNRRRTRLRLQGELLALITFLGWAQPARPAEPAPQTGTRALTFEELFGDPVIARGAGLEIRQSQLDKAFLAYRSNLAARGQRLQEDQRLLREAMLLDRMIVTHLLTNRASKMDQTAAVAMAEKFYTDTKKEAGSDENFVRQLKLTGLTPEQFNQRILEQSLAESVLDRELKSKISVSEAEIDEFYRTGMDDRVRFLESEIKEKQGKPEANTNVISRLQQSCQSIQTANLARLEIPETVRVAHVLISTRVPNQDTPLPEEKRQQKLQQAEAILKRARAGEDFLQLVEKHSEDRRLAESGGVYTFAREDRYAPEFKAAAFSLQPGQISDIVTTVFGYHVIKLLEKTPSRKRTLEELKKDIQSFLRQQKVQLAMPAYFKRLKAASKAEILEAKYKDVLPPDYSSYEPAGHDLP